MRQRSDTGYIEQLRESLAEVVEESETVCEADRGRWNRLYTQPFALPFLGRNTRSRPVQACTGTVAAAHYAHGLTLVVATADVFFMGGAAGANQQ